MNGQPRSIAASPAMPAPCAKRPKTGVPLLLVLLVRLLGTEAEVSTMRIGDPSGPEGPSSTTPFDPSLIGLCEMKVWRGKKPLENLLGAHRTPVPEARGIVPGLDRPNGEEASQRGQRGRGRKKMLENTEARVG
jgi:hypothetical protein